MVSTINSEKDILSISTQVSSERNPKRKQEDEVLYQRNINALLNQSVEPSTQKNISILSYDRRGRVAIFDVGLSGTLRSL